MKPIPVKEAEFVYKGYPCVVLFQPLGFRTAYVGLPKNSRYYDVVYNKIPIDCHGGLTYSRQSLFSQETVKNVWWIGFDCGHCFDKRDFEKCKKYYGEDIYQEIYSMLPSNGEIKTLDFCIQECKSIVDQIIKAEG